MCECSDRRWFISVLLATLAIPKVLVSADKKVWKKLRYEGGTVEANVNRFDWNTSVTITVDAVELTFSGYKSIRIGTGEVTRVSYGQKAYRRVADMATLSIFLTPVMLFGVLHKSRDHLVSIEFRDTAAGKPGAVLLMVHKDQYRELLLTLKERTGKPVENWP